VPLLSSSHLLTPIPHYDKHPSTVTKLTMLKAILLTVALAAYNVTAAPAPRTSFDNPNARALVARNVVDNTNTCATGTNACRSTTPS
jgi:hypothetical protein